MNKKHGEDTVDRNATAPPPGHNPPSRSHRARTAVLTIIGAALAAYVDARVRQRAWPEEPAHQLAGGLWLIAYGYLAGGYPPAPGYRNLPSAGALLSILGIIPTDGLQPTRFWREYYQDRAEDGRTHGG